MSKPEISPNGPGLIRNHLWIDRQIYLNAGDVAMALETMAESELDVDAQEALKRMSQRFFKIARGEHAPS